MREQPQCQPFCDGVMGKSSCFDEEETEPETFVSQFHLPAPHGMQGFEHIFGE